MVGGNKIDHFLEGVHPGNSLVCIIQKVDIIICWTNHYPVDSKVCFVNPYPPDSNLSVEKRYPPFKQLGPVVSNSLKGAYQLSETCMVETKINAQSSKA